MNDAPRIFMCPPAYYGIEYEINPWMHQNVPADPATAARQWSALVTILRECGATIELLDPVPGLPDLVFTANAGIVHLGRVILSRFRPAARRGEEQVFAEWFTRHGLEVVRLGEDQFFEGAGDALFCGETLFAGYRHRSDVRALQAVGELLGERVVAMELIDPYYYHVDTCFCPLEPGVAIYFPEAFDEYGRKSLREWIPTLVPVEREEASRFACNAVVLGRKVVTNVGCPRLHAELARLGFEPIETELDEFLKAGGSAKCLTLRLDGEDAAAWRHAAGRQAWRRIRRRPGEEPWRSSPR